MNSVCLLWKKIFVGELVKDNGYTFHYLPAHKYAESIGWTKLKPFPEEREYHSETLFPVFSSRLPDKRRVDIQSILEEYGMTEHDEFELLKRSGAKLPIDNYEFQERIMTNEDTLY